MRNNEKVLTDEQYGLLPDMSSNILSSFAVVVDITKFLLEKFWLRVAERLRLRIPANHPDVDIQMSRLWVLNNNIVILSTNYSISKKPILVSIFKFSSFFNSQLYEYYLLYNHRLLIKKITE